MVRVRYYAAARELAGLTEELVSVPQPMTADTFVSVLAERHPRLAGYVARMRLAVNGDLVTRGAPVADGDEVDVIPPVAGGAPHGDEPDGATPRARVALVDVREAALSVDECMAAVADPGAGGVALFVGVVRDHADGKAVARLDYEAHPVLAQKELRAVLVELAAAHPRVRLAVTHRTGQLGVGDAAIVVAASAPHRAEAFDVCRAAIDRIKERVPIWKKEWGPDGTAHWVNLEG